MPCFKGNKRTIYPAPTVTMEWMGPQITVTTTTTDEVTWVFILREQSHRSVPFSMTSAGVSDRKWAARPRFQMAKYLSVGAGKLSDQSQDADVLSLALNMKVNDSERTKGTWGGCGFAAHQSISPCPGERSQLARSAGSHAGAAEGACAPSLPSSCVSYFTIFLWGSLQALNQIA